MDKELTESRSNNINKLGKERFINSCKNYKRAKDIEGTLGLIKSHLNEDNSIDTILYARVSTQKQEEYLKNQIK